MSVGSICSAISIIEIEFNFIVFLPAMWPCASSFRVPLITCPATVPILDMARFRSQKRITAGLYDCYGATTCSRYASIWRGFVVGARKSTLYRIVLLCSYLSMLWRELYGYD